MTALRSQSRLASFIEACANTVIGFCISVTAQWFMFLWLGIKATPLQFVWLSIAMTILSVVRSYCLRRMWNAEWWKRFKRNHANAPARDGTMPPHHFNCRCVMSAVPNDYPCPPCVEATLEETVIATPRERSMSRKLKWQEVDYDR